MADGARPSQLNSRNQLASEPDFAVGSMLVRPSLCAVKFETGGARVEPRVMQVLVALAQAGGRVLSRDDLVQKCWGGAIVGDDAINRVLVRLRRLSKASGGQFEVETVRAVGYRLVARAPTRDAKAAPADTLARPNPPRRTALVLALGALAVAAVGALALWATRPAAVTSDRIVVLEFRSAGDPTLTAYAESLADRIRGTMSVNDLRTVARARNAEYRGPGMASLAASEGVSFVLDGGVEAEGDNLRVAMQVIDAGANLTLWSKEYTRPRAEGSWMQDQVAAHASEVLRCALITRRPKAGEIEPAVLSTFLRACDKVERFEAGGSDMTVAARDLTERAPRFSQAWSMLALASAFASNFAPAEQAGALRDAAKAAAERSMALDGSNGEGLLALAVLYPQGTSWKERQALVTQAIALDPDLADAHVLQAEIMSEVGRVSEAVAHLRQAAALEPLAPVHWASLVPALSAMGDLDETARIRDRLQRTWPNSVTARFNRFKNLMFTGEPAPALAMLEAREINIREPSRTAVQAFLQAQVSGDRARLRESVMQLAQLARSGRYDIPSTVSSASMSGDLDLAFELADLHFSGSLAAVGPRQPPRGATSSFLFLAPAENLRRDPRFIDLAERIGLVAYWQETGVWPDFCALPDLAYDCRTASSPHIEARR